MVEGLEFDPGFAPYIMAFKGSVEYLYSDINKFKNFSQKKTKFRQYYQKILQIFNNNLGFYIGCLMWAAYISTQEKQEILNNHCLGNRYNEYENIAETDFLINFTGQFSKDMKYFLNEKFEFDRDIIEILKTYRTFLLINKGFINSKYNTDIILPDNINHENTSMYKETIDEIIKQGDLSLFVEYKDVILK